MKTPSDKKPKTSLFKKIRIIATIIITLSLLSVSIYAYFWYQSVSEANQQALAAIQKARNLETLKKAILSEQATCKNFITKGSGDFNQYSYCSQFLKWSETLDNTLSDH